MNREQWNQVEEFYHAALRQPAAQRAVFLEAACVDDALRREVESLLAQPSGDALLPGIQAAAQLLEDSTVTVLPPGTCLGPYRIEGNLGEGGMGEVYRAVDTRLGRAVAIKIAHQRFSQRFEREARAIAALNHRHVCTLHDVGSNYLVMELLEGETLSARLRKGPLPMELAACYGAEIADALAAAHTRGIIHRDLKPTNIILTKAGIKVLDFGLAKFEHPVGVIKESETLTADHAIMGTLAYMSPEQLAGQECDARSDIFALGLVLYEMLAGKRAFAGEDRAALIAEVARCQPPPLENVLAQIGHVVERCLEKDPEDRWQAARDVKLELEWITRTPAEAAGEQVAASRRILVPWLVAAALAIALTFASALLWRASRPVEHPLTRLSVDLGPNALAGQDTTVAISPDGRRLIYPARGPDGKQQLATRLLDQPQATLLAGTENGQDAFFSPDGQWVGFFADGKLRKISVQGGAAVTLCDATFPLGGSWGEGGDVVAALNNFSPLSRVPASGGTPQRLTKRAGGEVTHRWPQVLPGGQAVLFTADPTTAGMEDADIEVVSLKTGAAKILEHGGYYGRYLPSGHLVYVHQGVLFGVGFDAAKLEVRGSAIPVVEDLAGNPSQGGGQFDFSAASSGTGTLVYLAGKASTQSWPISWLDSSGKTQPLRSTPGAYVTPNFSPDGRRLAVAMTSKGSDIFVYDWQRDALTRRTFDEQSRNPVWSPDGRHIAFRSNSPDGFSIFWMRSDGVGEPRHLLENQSAVFPWSFSPDGRRLAYMKMNPETGYDIWTLPLDVSDPDHPKPGKPEPFLRSPFDELLPMFSPDGRWIAYRSNESGSTEIYVRPFAGAGAGGEWQISTGGGMYAFWSNNGRELFYETADYRIMVVDYIVNGDSFVPGKPRVWSGKPIFYPGLLNLALHPDGKRFAVFPMPEGAPGEKGSVHVTMLLNFFDELRRRIPVSK